MEKHDYGLSIDCAESDNSSSSGLDLVIVHGLYGNLGASPNPRVSPGSGSSSWVDDYLKDLDVDARILIFRYDAGKILAGRHSRDAIQQQAVSLLEGLTKLRGTDSERSIMFISHDIGGLIVKDALQIAVFDSIKWGEIPDYARMLVGLLPYSYTDH
ncbi:hypothetical protein BDV32DRAFT_153079 [Aspergillus pseudonomiae]|nr:hypothetical protein BDV32DRAFT_153079 [Aspergillus pseudonomiae]